MSRGAKTAKLQVIFDYVYHHPGCNRAEIARATGLTYKQVGNHVTTMELQGYLLSEDERCRLYAVRVVKGAGA